MNIESALEQLRGYRKAFVLTYSQPAYFDAGPIVSEEYVCWKESSCIARFGVWLWRLQRILFICHTISLSGIHWHAQYISMHIPASPRPPRFVGWAAGLLGGFLTSKTHGFLHYENIQLQYLGGGAAQNSQEGVKSKHDTQIGEFKTNMVPKLEK